MPESPVTESAGPQLAEWEEQGYHFAGMIITFLCAWFGIFIALTVDRFIAKATSLLSLFAGGVLFAGGMVHLLGDALEVLRETHAEHGQLIALCLCSVTYILLFILNVMVTAHFSSKLQRRSKKEDRVHLMVDEDDDLGFSPEVITIQPNSSAIIHDEAEMFIASLENAGLRSSALLMCVLSLHSFLAGLAFGSQPDPAEEFKIMIPIAAHKSLAAMALAVTFKKANIRRFNMFILLLIFSCSTPSGTVCGMIISASVDSQVWTGSGGCALSKPLFGAEAPLLTNNPLGVCLAVASGTFIYVTLNDIIPTEILKNSDMLVTKCCALVLGFSSMALLALWT